MNIAFVTTEYITEEEYDGGLANYLYRLSQALISRGHHVEVFTLSKQDKQIFHQNVLIHQVQIRSKTIDRLNRITCNKIRRTLRFLSLSYFLYKRFIKRLQRQHFDIIQASSCFACGLFVKMGNSLPQVIRISSYEPLFRQFYRQPLTFDQRICEWLELLAIKRADAAYAPSNFIAHFLQKHKSIPVEVIRPPFYLETKGHDPGIYEQNLAEKKYFLFFGSIGYLKGCDCIAQALPRLLSNYPDLYFVFVGQNMEGPGGKSMMEYIYSKAGKYKDRVCYFGVMRHHQLYPIIRQAYAIVLPSLVDNLPNTMLEAMAFRKVVIGTYGTSFEEFIEHRNSGFLVELGDSDSLAEAMDQVYNMSETERSAIGSAAHEKVRHLSPQSTCKDLEDYFQGIIDNNRVIP